MSDSQRSILLITPHFAPESHAAVFRVHKLAKFLPQRGWKVHVLTVDTNYEYIEDPKLLAELPESVVIHRARYIEPSLRGLRRIFNRGEFSKRSVTPPKSNQQKPSNTRALPPKKLGTLKRLYHYLLENYFYVPDRFHLWAHPASRMAKKIMLENNIRTFYTTAPPYSMSMIGCQLKKDGFRWIADFRDPLTTDHRLKASNVGVFLEQKEATDKMAFNCDELCVASSSAALLLADQYGEEVAKKTHFIPTGLDPELIPKKTKRPMRSPYLIFTGEYLKHYRNDTLKLFKAAFEKAPRSKVKIVVIGRLAINEPNLMPSLRELGLEDRFILKDHMPQAELYQWVLHAKAALMMGSTKYRWAILYAKMIDYLALRKPILGLVPNPSESRRWMEATKLGILLDSDPKKSVPLLLKVLKSGTAPLVRPVAKECDRFLVDNQVSQFEEVFLPSEIKVAA